MTTTITNIAHQFIQALCDQNNIHDIEIKKNECTGKYQLIIDENTFIFSNSQTVKRFAQSAQNYLLKYELAGICNISSTLLSSWLLLLSLEGKLTSEIISIFSGMTNQ